MSEFDIPNLEGIKCNDFYELGIEKFPIFDVDQQTFHQNITVDNQNLRKRLVPQENTELHKYLTSGTQASYRPFAIRTSDSNGNVLMKKIR